MRKSKDFPANDILRENSFGDFRTSKTAIFTVLGKVKKCHQNLTSEPKKCQNGNFWNFWNSKR